MTIDQRIVEMQLHNDKFLSNASTSIKALKELDKALDLSGAAKNLNDLQKISNKFSLASIANGVDTVAKRFTTLGLIGVGALEEIGRKAVVIGTKITKAFTVDPIHSGFKEYETQINATQTILANTARNGTTLKEVTAALEELNHYADKTIYNFTEMTRNIGTFTAAGVDLETSTKAIKGIANLAAASGSTSQQASTAMYQLSQALASGKVNLQDWNSVVNAGMGGTMFQDSLIETARVHGIAVDEMIAKQGSFRESLREGWLTSAVLTETLMKFTGDLSKEELKSIGYTDEQIANIVKLGNTANDAATKVKTFTQLMDTLKEAAQSGWTKSWEIIIGDFEEARDLLTSISDKFSEMINKSSDARNALLQGWKELGGRNSAINAVKNIFESILNIIRPIKRAFEEIFPKTTAQQLYNITKSIENFTEKLKIGGNTANNIRRTFRGVFAVFDIGLSAVKALARGFANLIAYIAPTGGSLLSITGDIGSFLVSLRDAIKESDTFNKAIDNIGKVLKPLGDAIKFVIGKMSELIGVFKSSNSDETVGFVDRLKQKFEPLSKLLDTMIDKFKGFFKVSGAITKAISNAIGAIATGIVDLVRTIASAIREGGAIQTLTDTLIVGAFVKMVAASKDYLKESAGIIVDGIKTLAGDVKGVIGNISDIFTGLGKALEAFQNNLNAKTLLNIAIAIAVLTASLYVLSSIPANKLMMSLAGIGGMFAELMAALSSFTGIVSGFKGVQLIQLSVGLAILAGALTILSAAVKNLSTLSWDELLTGLTGVGILSAIMVKTLKSLNTQTKGIIKTSTGLVIFGLALKILTKSVQKLGEMDTDKLTKGLIGVGALCTELALFLKASDFDNLGMFKGVGLMAVAGAIVILSSAVEKFSSIPTNNLIKGLAAVAAALTEITLFTKVSGNAKHVISTAASLVIMGGALHILASAVSKMGDMQWDEIGRGLTVMGGALGIVAIAMNALPKGMLTKGIGLTVVAAGLNVLATAMIQNGSMSWDEIARSLTVLAGGLTIISVAMLALNKSITGAAALLTIAAALRVFIPVIQTLGSMSLGEIGMALLGLAGIFVVVGGAAAVLSPLTPALLGLSIALAVLGAAILAIGAGVTLFAAGMATMAAAGTAVSATLVELVRAFLGLIPEIIQKLGEGVIAFAEVIAKGAPKIAAAIIAVVQAILQTLAETAPDITEKVASTLLKVLQTIRKYLPDLLQAGIDIVLQLMEGIANNIGKITDKAIDIITAFLDAIGGRTKDIVDAGFNLMIDFIRGLADSIRENMPILLREVGNLAGAIIDGLVSGLSKGVGKFLSSIGDLAKKGLNKFKSVLGIHSPSTAFEDAGIDSVLGYVKGLDSKEYAVESQSEDLADVAIAAIKSKDNGFLNAAKGNANAMVSGYNDKIPNVEHAAGNLATRAADAISSKDGSFKQAGIDSMSEYGEGLLSQQDSLLEQVTTRREQIEEVLKKPYQQAVLEGDINNSNWNQWNAMDAPNSWKNNPTTDINTIREIIRSMGGEFNAATVQAWNEGGYEALKKKIEQDKAFATGGYDAGYNYGKGIDDGYQDYQKKHPNLVQDGQNILKPDISTPSRTDDYYDDGYDSGSNISAGISDGVKEGIDKVVDSMSNVASGITNMFDKLLGIHSPSRVFFEKAKQIDIGLANGLIFYAPLVQDALYYLNENIVDMSPTITPVINLDEADRGLRLLDKMAADGDILSAPVSYDRAHGVETEKVASQETKAPQPTNISFTQNNYSPKALSRIDIYRQTKNQIRQVKEVIKAQ